jgi:hypothetical protein
MSPVTDRPATAADIREIIGHVDEPVIASILETGATPAEVTAAFTHLNADDYMGGDLERPAAGRVGQVLAILEAQLPAPDEAGPPTAPPT